MNVTDTRSTRIAVFIDFDNVEIGVKNTIGGSFDIGLVLEAIKERGEIVTKIAYSDWKQAGDYSRLLTQHAIRMVQRNMTPGGDKNGADITMALDALEMAFTHDHINAFVIVGGDSDFISLIVLIFRLAVIAFFIITFTILIFLIFVLVLIFIFILIITAATAVFLFFLFSKR